MSDWLVGLTIVGWAVCVWGACSIVMRGLGRFDRWREARPARRDRVALREWREQRAALQPTFPLSRSTSTIRPSRSHTVCPLCDRPVDVREEHAVVEERFDGQLVGGAFAHAECARATVSESDENSAQSVEGELGAEPFTRLAP